MEVTGDYYAVLRVAPEAEHAVIRLAYRDLMRRHHPDVNSSFEAAAKATAINEAYACLRDPIERAAYDRHRTAWQTTQGSTAASRPRRPSRSAWPAQQTYIVEARAPFELSWWKAAGLGLAMLLTILTFTLTSATPAAPPPAPNAVVFVESTTERPIISHGGPILYGAQHQTNPS